MMLQLHSLLFTQMSWTHTYTLKLARGFHRKFCPNFWSRDITKMYKMYKQHLAHPYNETLFSDKKEIKKLELALLSCKRHGRHPNEKFEVWEKKVNMERLYVWVQLCNILGKAKLWRQFRKNNQWSLRVEDGVNRLGMEDFVLFWR